MPPHFNDPQAYDYKPNQRSKGTSQCHLVWRIIVAILCVVCLAFIAAAFGVNLASFDQTVPAPTARTHLRLWRIAADGNGSGWYRDALISATRAFMVIGLVAALVALILAIIYIVYQGKDDEARIADDAEREAVREEYLRRLQERRQREEEVKAGRREPSYAADFDVRPPSHPRSYYVDREQKRMSRDWIFGLLLWACIIAIMVCMAISIACFYSFYKRDIKDLGNAKVVVGFWLMCVALIVAFIAAVLLPIEPATGWNICIGTPADRKA